MTTITNAAKLRGLLKELEDAQLLGRDGDPNTSYAVCCRNAESHSFSYHSIVSLTKAEARMIGEWKEEIIQRELKALGLEVASRSMASV